MAPGKARFLKLMMGDYKPNEGQIHIQKDATVSIGLQVMAREHMEKTMREFFAHAFEEVPYNLDGQIKNVLEVVNLQAPLDKHIKTFSGGQQARLLLAYALIQEPDILLQNI
jgi:ATPase subunit of ABC transporter with duplicated ATPase domains